jgi:hypothetical protein
MRTREITGIGRLAAFGDGVIAIIITIMVLELKVPHGVTAGDLRPLLPDRRIERVIGDLPAEAPHSRAIADAPVDSLR